ncbi:M23 family metallopeptidase [Paenibacillus pasadenensis]|uniref:M23 family metallopeptidase n=1 Tax=Paenibacillus pasadenensis TaxID=217090 RepID=UPI00203D4DD9|nr:M23 family metallopeptidase [Paenibacillus pasadenensis]MCM3746709.1 M23 family metallopeptidase [Paenibacillus pasadenensis]
MSGQYGRWPSPSGWGKKQDKATRERGIGNRERRQERIRELTERLGSEEPEVQPIEGNRPIANDARIGRQLTPAGAPGSAGKKRSEGGKPSRRPGEKTGDSLGKQPAAGPYGTRVYHPNAPADWEQPPLDGAWLEAWPQPTDRDPEIEWKNSANPWRRLEEASGVKGGLGERRSISGRSGGVPGGSGGGNGGQPGNLGSRIAKGFSRRLLVSAALFAAVWGLFQLDGAAARHGQALVREALTKPMNMAAVAGWYEGLFGAPPSFIPGFGDNSQQASAKPERAAETPVEGGSIVRSFAELLGGVEISGQPGAEVRAAEEGRVLLVSASDAKGPTVVLQHAGGRTTYYAQLGEANVAANDWVEAGDAIGTLGQAAEGSEAALLYFAVKDKDRYIDPADVIPFD